MGGKYSLEGVFKCNRGLIVPLDCTLGLRCLLTGGR